MDENIKKAANSGVFYVGAMDSFRERYEWLKWYYEHKGYRFCDVRKHVIARYTHVLDILTFKNLFELFTYQMLNGYRARLCDVANDDDDRRLCCPFYDIYLPDSDRPPRHVYPSIKFHPMSVFRGYKPPCFGYFTICDLVERLSKNGFS